MGRTRGTRPSLIFRPWAEKKIFWRPGPPLSKGLDDRPPPLSQDLDPALLYLTIIKHNQKGKEHQAQGELRYPFARSLIVFQRSFSNKHETLVVYWALN